MAEAVAVLVFGTLVPQAARRYLNAVLLGRTLVAYRLNKKAVATSYFCDYGLSTGVATKSKYRLKLNVE